MAFLKTIWKVNSKHKKLLEELSLKNSKELESDTVEPLDNDNDVITFKLKYLGSTIIEKFSHENGCKEAVKNILKSTKAAKGKKKIQRVNVNISLKGIAATDPQGNDILQISIFRISNCSTDSTHPQIFSFISTDTNEIMECHAFLCSKRKLAETVTLAVAQAFNAVYEAWKRSPDSENLPQITTTESMKAIVNAQALPNSRVEEKLINFDSDEEDDFQCEFTPHQQTGLQWVCFEEEFGAGMTTSLNKNINKIDLVLA